MGRRSKKGLDFAPIDTGILGDSKIVALTVNCPGYGFGVLVELLLIIYDEGYYVNYNDAITLKICKDQGVTADEVQRAVDVLVKYGFFDEGLYTTSGVLTSKGIQRRWLVGKRGRVEEADLVHWLLGDEMDKKQINATKKPINADFGAEMPKNVILEGENNPKNVILENKVAETHTSININNKDKIKNKNTIEGACHTRASARQALPPEEKEMNFEKGEVAALCRDPDVAAMQPTQLDVDKFYAYYAQRGWQLAPGIVMSDIKQGFIAWLLHRSEFKADVEAMEADRRQRRKQREVDEAATATPSTPSEPVHYLSGEELDALLKSHNYGVPTSTGIVLNEK